MFAADRLNGIHEWKLAKEMAGGGQEIFGEGHLDLRDYRRGDGDGAVKINSLFTYHFCLLFLFFTLGFFFGGSPLAEPSSLADYQNSMVLELSFEIISISSMLVSERFLWPLLLGSISFYC